MFSGQSQCERVARAFNAQDIEAAAAMYHPAARVVHLPQVHGSDNVAPGAEGIRETMAGYVGLKPHMDVVVHHATVAGDFAPCRSQWRIAGNDRDGKAAEGGRGRPSWYGGHAPPGKRRMGLLHRSPVGSRCFLGRRSTAADRMTGLD